MIDTKPGEPWLVVHHRDACRGKFEEVLLKRLTGDRHRVRFLSWGRHQGTNDFADIPNVILAGTLFMPDGQYQGLTYLSANVPLERELSPSLTERVRVGEHCDLILQALCRGAVRGSDGRQSKRCDAYIIASKTSGIRRSLPMMFPGCRVIEWKPRHKPLRGKVSEAVAYIEKRLSLDPLAAITFAELMQVLGIADKSNFNRTIRKHRGFTQALERMGLVEVTVEGSRQPCALRRVFAPLSVVPQGPEVLGSDF